MNENKKITYASTKPTEELMFLFQKAQSLDINGLGYAEIFERACHYLINNETSINFENLLKRKYSGKYHGTLPASFKFRINNIKLHENIINLIRKVYNLKRITTPFMIRVCMSAYINKFENSFTDNGVKDISSNDIEKIKLKAISLILNCNNNSMLEKTIKSLEEI